MALPLRQRDRRSAVPARAVPAPRPQLAVVPGRRRFAWFAVTLSIMMRAVPAAWANSSAGGTRDSNSLC